MTKTRDEIEDDAIEAARSVFLAFTAIKGADDLLGALSVSIRAYEAAMWQPLDDSGLSVFRDVMVKDKFWRYKPVPILSEQQSLVAPNGTGNFPTST